MMKHLRQRYCIVGVGHTVYGKNPGVSQVAHNVLAIRAALKDAGLTTDDLDGVLTKAPTSTFPMLWGAQDLRGPAGATQSDRDPGSSRGEQYWVNPVRHQCHRARTSRGHCHLLRRQSAHGLAGVVCPAPRRQCARGIVWRAFELRPWWHGDTCTSTAPRRNSSAVWRSPTAPTPA